MRKLYLIRHGQCRDGAHRCIGGTDLPLDEVGLCQAERLRQWARSKPLTAVYTSPLSRCRETARILSDGRLPVHTADGLREMDGACGRDCSTPTSGSAGRRPTPPEAPTWAPFLPREERAFRPQAPGWAAASEASWPERRGISP